MKLYHKFVLLVLVAFAVGMIFSAQPFNNAHADDGPRFTPDTTLDDGGVTINGIPTPCGFYVGQSTCRGGWQNLGKQHCIGAQSAYYADLYAWSIFTLGRQQGTKTGSVLICSVGTPSEGYQECSSTCPTGSID